MTITEYLHYLGGIRLPFWLWVLITLAVVCFVAAYWSEIADRWWRHGP